MTLGVKSSYYFNDKLGSPSENVRHDSTKIEVVSFFMGFYILALLMVLGFYLQALVIKRFFKELVKSLVKILHEANVPITYDEKAPKTPAHFVNQKIQSPLDAIDRPEKNYVLDDKAEEEDYNENLYIPPGVKVEVEGGDSQVPPGYEESTGGAKK